MFSLSSKNIKGHHLHQILFLSAGTNDYVLKVSMTNTNTALTKHSTSMFHKCSMCCFALETFLQYLDVKQEMNIIIG